MASTDDNPSLNQRPAAAQVKIEACEYPIACQLGAALFATAKELGVPMEVVNFMLAPANAELRAALIRCADQARQQAEEYARHQAGLKARRRQISLTGTTRVTITYNKPMEEAAAARFTSLHIDRLLGQGMIIAETYRERLVARRADESSCQELELIALAWPADVKITLLDLLAWQNDSHRETNLSAALQYFSQVGALSNGVYVVPGAKEAFIVRVQRSDSQVPMLGCFVDMRTVVSEIYNGFDGQPLPVYLVTTPPTSP